MFVEERLKTESAGAPPPPDELRTSISVCIPAFNESRNIGALLRFLKSEAPKLGRVSEVLVNASGSTDGTQQIIENYSQVWPAVRLIDTGGREGLVRALSVLLSLATGDIIIRLDADVSLEPGSLGTLLAAMADSTVGIVGPRIIAANNGTRLLRRLSDAQFAIYDLVSRRSPKTTNVQVFRRIRVNFDQEDESEDNLLQKAVTDAGLRAVYEPSAVARVAFPTKVSELFSWRIRCIATSRWFKTRHGHSSATQDPRIVFAALLEGIRGNRFKLSGLAAYLGLEMICQAEVSVASAISGPHRTLDWPQLRTTKSPLWGRTDQEDSLREDP